MSVSARIVCVLLIAPSLAITGGQSVQAAKLLSILGNVSQIEMKFFPIDPALPAWIAWTRRVKFLRTLVMLLFYCGGLLLRVPQCDVMHVFTAGLSSYSLWTIPALLLCKVFGKKFVMHYHDGQAEQHLREWRWAAPTIKLADRLIVPSGFLVDVFAKYNIRARVISNVVELERFRFRRRTKLLPKIMTNRMLEPLYNVPCVLRAFSIIQGSYPEASLTIAHDGWCRLSLEQLGRDLGLRNVHFVGRVRYEEVAELYDDADIYVMTPNIDNMPGSLLECFASGLPAISTKAGGVPYIAQDRGTALLVDLDDHKAVAERALELLSDPELVASLTERGLEEVQKYHWKPIRDQWIALYQEATGILP